MVNWWAPALRSVMKRAAGSSFFLRLHPHLQFFILSAACIYTSRGIFSTTSVKLISIFSYKNKHFVLFLQAVSLLGHFCCLLCYKTIPYCLIVVDIELFLSPSKNPGLDYIYHSEPIIWFLTYSYSKKKKSRSVGNNNNWDSDRQHNCLPLNPSKEKERSGIDPALSPLPGLKAAKIGIVLINETTLWGLSSLLSSEASVHIEGLLLLLIGHISDHRSSLSWCFGPKSWDPGTAWVFFEIT